MAGILRPGPNALWRTGQVKPVGIPRIDWTHPLAFRLVSYWWDLGTGFHIDLVSGHTTAKDAGGNLPTRKSSLFGDGSGFTANTTSTHDPAAYPIQTWASPYSAAAGWYQLGATTFSANVGYFGIYDSTGNNGPAFFGGTATTFGCSLANQASSYTFTYAANTLYVVVAAATGASASSHWVNGIAQTAGVATTAFSGSGLGVELGAPVYNGAGASNPNSILFFGAVWNGRALNASEARLLYTDPYCFLLPPEGEMPALFLQAVGLPSGLNPIFSEHVPPPPPPGFPQQWKGFLDLPQIYAQQPVGARQLSFNDATAIVRPGQPERWQHSFFDLAYIYAQTPVGAASVEVHRPAPMGNPERWRPFHEMAYIYAQSPIGATSVEVHPLAAKGNPEYWNTIFDNTLPQIYSQKPVGARWEDDAHPVIRPGTPEKARPFFELSYIYSQQPIGATKIDDAHPVVRLGTPEYWQTIIANALPQIYSQKPVGARQDADAPPLYVKGPEPLPLDLLTTTLGPAVVGATFVFRGPLLVYHQPPPPPPEDTRQNILLTTLGTAVTVTLPFVYYDFSAHPGPGAPSQFVPNINTLPQIYAQSPIGATRIDDAHPVVRGNPERWKAFYDLSIVYSQTPVGAIRLGDATAVVRPGQPELWKAFYDLSIIYSQQPIGREQLSFDTPPLIRLGVPERWKSFFDLPQVYAQQPTGASSLGFFNFPPPIIRASAEWLTPDLLATLLTATPPTLPFVYYDFSNHPGYRTTAEPPIFPNVVLSFAPTVQKAIEWILRARRRHNR